METKNGDMTISSWRRLLQSSGELRILTSFTFEVTENGGVILQEEKMVFHSRLPTSRQTVATKAQSFQDVASDNDHGEWRRRRRGRRKK